jgi:hypothetical protein
MRLNNDTIITGFSLLYHKSTRRGINNNISSVMHFASIAIIIQSYLTGEDIIQVHNLLQGLHSCENAFGEITCSELINVSGFLLRWL